MRMPMVALLFKNGYYPTGEVFSDLTHYFRSGDFVLTLLTNAQV
jgi:hypothetical protein